MPLPPVARGMIRVIALILCAAGQLPAGCPALPAGQSGSVAGPVVLPVKIGPTLPAPCRCAAGQGRWPTCRAVGPTLPARGAADVLRCRSTLGRLPHAPDPLPTRRRSRSATDVPRGRPHAPGPWCCRPVTREALPARGAADVLRCRSTPGRLPRVPGPSGRIGCDAASDRDVAARSSGWWRS